MLRRMDAARVIQELRELDERSGGRRVAWTDTCEDERRRLSDAVSAEVPGVVAERDAAGNRWLRLPGESDETVIAGSHLDCVPGGGWLDGCLGVLAAVEALRTLAARGRRPRRSLAVVDWSDEEGARFGHSLLGSSAASGQLDLADARALSDADGVALADALAAHGVELDRMPDAAGSLRGAVAALELHIEQGPVLEQQGRPMCAVSGCLGVRRAELAFEGRAVHAGATPMTMRKDPVLAAARFVTSMTGTAIAADGLATIGALRAWPGTPTAVAGEVRLTVDLRHREEARLSHMDARVHSLASAAAAEHGCRVTYHPLWRIKPVAFDADLVARARRATGRGASLVSGPLHDSAALQRAGVPTAMVFVRTRGGVSHTREEDAAEGDLLAAIEAYGRLVISLVDDRPVEPAAVSR
jgi:N-carbamoyl-L-amino-acid hydrolase